MRKLFLILLTSCIGQAPYAQLQDGSFEGWTAGCIPSAPTRCDPSHLCSPFWFPSHGTPQIFRNSDGLNGPSYAYMWHSIDGENRGEGMFTNFIFAPSVTYTFSLGVRRIQKSYSNTINGELRVVAANGLMNNCVTGELANQTIPNPAQQSAIATIQNIGYTWERRTFSFTAPSNMTLKQL
ncbi:MAG: hypothetical protein EOP04_31490, partial [Proteobacteria bacterium]